MELQKALALAEVGAWLSGSSSFYISCALVFLLHACLYDPLELELQTAVSCHVGAGN